MPDYRVTVEGSDPMPIRAANQAQARNFAVRNKVKVETLTIDDAMEFGRNGINIMIASDEPAGDPPAENTDKGTESQG